MKWTNDTRTLGLIKRTCRDLNDVGTTRTLYCSLINPYTKCNIDKLEAVQRIGTRTRWITRSSDDYDTRLSKLKLLTLSDWRFRRGVTFLFNVINGNYDIDILNKLIFCKERNEGHNFAEK